MNSRSLLSCVIIACCSILLLGSACSTPGTQYVGPTDPENTGDPGAGIYRTGDKIVIEFADNPGLPQSWPQTVREDGSITLPLNQTTRAAGLRKGELEQAIREIYVNRFVTRLTVNIRAEQRFYFVTGEVRTPSKYEHPGAMTAMKAIAQAGDFTDFADKSDIVIYRADGDLVKVNGKKAQRDAKYDAPVFAGDRIHVNRRYI